MSLTYVGEHVAAPAWDHRRGPAGSLICQPSTSCLQPMGISFPSNAEDPKVLKEPVLLYVLFQHQDEYLGPRI